MCIARSSPVADLITAMPILDARFHSMRSSSHTIDISVVTFNSEKWIQPFVDSLVSQDLPLSRVSLLLRDNGSRDNTVKLLRQIREKLIGQFSRIEIEEGDNVGFGRGHNANLKKVGSEYFLVTNVDLEFEANTLTTLLDTAVADAAEVAAWECRQKPFEHPKDYHPVTGDTEWCSSACVLLRASAVRAVGGYEPRLFLYGEDVELSYRLRDYGHRLRYVPQATVWHHTYEEAAEVKPQQFLGSTLANVLLRCRYGRSDEVFQGFAMYLGLFFMPIQFKGQRRGLLSNLLRLFWLAPQFLTTRHRSQRSFPFRMWDYAMSREGAFYRYSDRPLSQQPLVSVLVRTMPGRSGKLREAVSSVVAQTYQNIELVIVEDGGATAQPLVDALRATKRFPNLIYLPCDKAGRCVAGNTALKAATGTLVCFLDDDDLFYADHLEVLVAAWDKQPQLGAVYSLAYEVRSDIVSHEPWVYRDIMHCLIYRQPFNRPLLWHHNYLPIQTVLFQRKLFLEYGGFDTELENLEDWNLWVRYSLRHEFLLVPKVTSLYRVPSVAEHAVQRQQQLDEYYAKAQAQHAKLRIELSPPEILAIAQALSRELYVSGIPTSWLRSKVLGTPVLRRFYHPIRRIWHKFRNR